MRYENYWRLTVSGTLCVIAPEVALTITCTVVGVPDGVGAATAGALDEEEQPLTASVRQAAIAMSTELRTSKERLRRPTKARIPRGVAKASVTPPAPCDTLPAT